MYSRLIAKEILRKPIFSSQHRTLATKYINIYRFSNEANVLHLYNNKFMKKNNKGTHAGDDHTLLWSKYVFLHLNIFNSAMMNRIKSNDPLPGDP